jgi:hypothetical protein
MRVHPDGSLDLAQNILPLPGVPTDMPVPPPTYGRMLRDLQLGQKVPAAKVHRQVPGRRREQLEGGERGHGPEPEKPRVEKEHPQDRPAESEHK